MTPCACSASAIGSRPQGFTWANPRQANLCFAAQDLAGSIVQSKVPTLEAKNSRGGANNSMIACGCVANRGGADGSWLRRKWDVGVHLNTGQLSHNIHHSNGEGFSGREYAGPHGARHLSML